MANVPGGIRTPNLLIRSQLLYPVELQTHRAPVLPAPGGTASRKLAPQGKAVSVVFLRPLKASVWDRCILLVL